MTAEIIPLATASDFLRKAREFAGLTQSQLADKLGVATRTVVDCENGVRPIRTERVTAWAMATGVDAGWLQWNVDAASQHDMLFNLDIQRYSVSEVLTLDELRARRDSNSQPSDSEFAQVIELHPVDELVDDAA